MAAPVAAALAAVAVSPFHAALALLIVACGIAGAAALWTAARTGTPAAGLAVAVVAIGALGGLERFVGGILDAHIPGVSMRPLTAVALVVAGSALFCVATRRERAGRLLAVLPFLFAAGVLFGEFASGTLRAAAPAAITSLPNSALALLFGSVGLLVWPSDDSRLRASIVWTCGVMSALIALTALCGHLFDIEHMNSWSGVSLSLLAALGYGTLGIGLVSALPAVERRRSWAPVVLGIAAIALGVTAWLFLLPHEETRVSGTTRTVLDVTANQLRRELATTGNALRRLGERLASGLDEAAFRRDGANYLRDHTALAALSWRRGGDVWTLARNDEGSEAALRHLQTLAEGTRLARVAERALLEQTWTAGNGTLVSAVAIDTLASSALAPVAAGYAVELRSGARRWFADGDTATEWAQSVPIRAGDEILTLEVAPKASVVGDSSSRQPEIALFAAFVVAGVLVLALRLAGHAKESARTAERASLSLREEIDAHRRTGVALDDLRDNTDSVLATISDGFVAIDRAWRFRFVNRSAARMLGLDAATIAGAPLDASGVLALYRDKLVETMREHRTADFEIVSQPPDRTIAVRAFAQREGAALYLRDVSAEKTAMRSLADSRALLAQAQRMAQLGSWHWFRDSGVMTWSDALYDIVGARVDATTPSFEALAAPVHPDDRAAVASAFAELIAGRDDLDLEYRLLVGDGTIRYVRSIAQADGAGTATLSGTLQDVSVARRRQEDLSTALDRAERQAMQLRSMRHVSLIASSKLGDADLPQVLVEEVREAIGAHIGRVTLFAEPEGMASASIVSLSDKYADWRDTTAEVGFDGRREGSNAVLRLSEAALAAQAPPPAGRLPLRGLLSVPLRDRRGSVVGILDLSDRYDGDFTADDEMVLMQFAQTFSIAIGWSKLIDTLRATQARLENKLDEFARSRALLAEAERVAQLGCWEIEVLPDGRRRRAWSEQTYRLFGLQPGAEPPDPDVIAPLVHEDDRPQLAAAVAGAFERAEPFSLDFRIATREGALRWIHSEANVARDAKGAIARVFGTSQDVTERKYVEQQTLARAEILRSVASGAPLVRTLTAIAELYELRFPGAACSVLLCDPRGRLYTVAAPNLPVEYSRLIDGIEIGPSAGSCGTAAWRRQQVIVGDIANDPLWASWRDVALRFGLKACWSTPVLDKAGETLATFAVYYGAPREPTHKELGKIADVVSIASIAIEAARAHARIADSEQRLRSLFAYVPEAVFAHDLDGRIVECNDAAVETSGYPRGAIVTRGFADFVAPEHRDAATDCIRLALKGEVCRFEHEGVRPDGTRYNAATTTLPIVVGGATVGMYAISRDVTVQIEARAELENALRTTTANNRELEEFAFVASHDLQEPLRKVRAFGERLRAHAGAALDAQSVDYVERMRAAAERMQRLIDDLLAYSRVSTRERCVTAVDLDRVLREALLDLETRIAETGAAVASDVLPVIEADATQMRQVLQNLIGNALKFRHPDRKPHVAVRAQFVRQSSAAAPDWLRIVVEDNGIGFDNRYRDRIFAPFQRLHGRNEYEGSGIGLAIVRRIVERHGGVLAADGDVGRGARFTIELPTRQSQPQAPNRAPEGKSA